MEKIAHIATELVVSLLGFRNMQPLKLILAINLEFHIVIK